MFCRKALLYTCFVFRDVNNIVGKCIVGKHAFHEIHKLYIISVL